MIFFLLSITLLGLYRSTNKKKNFQGVQSLWNFCEQFRDVI